uniref:Non-specific serine/threonine protein kinase n=1 Tax=Parascaris equorum TaxID=6256 RepID=A0A914RQV6_PAREQ
MRLKKLLRLCLSPSGSHFASAGNDGLMKIWSVSRIYKDQSAATRADATFSYSELFAERKINSIQFVGSLGKRLAIASDDCRVTVVDAERMAFITTIGFEKDEDGPPVELYASDNDKNVTTALATCPLTGRIFTGDSVGALRSWNLLNPKECYYLSGPEKRTPEAISSSSLRSTIKRSTFEMVEVFYEEAFEKKQRSSPALSNSPLEAQ